MSNPTPEEPYKYGAPPQNQYPYPGPTTPYGYGQPVYPGQPQYSQIPRTNPFSIVGISVSGLGVLLAFFMPAIVSIVGIVFSAISLHQIKFSQPNERGRGLALAGLWIGIGTLVLQVIVIVLFVIFFVVIASNSSGGYTCDTGFYCPTNT